jgi:putative ABC transport system substrate-binding protein
MIRREFITLLGGMAVAWPLAASAQEAGRIHTIGWLNAGAFDPTSPVLTSFLNALPELGWIEGKNVLIESRFAENRLERLPEFAAELVRLKVDVIVGIGTLAPLAAKRATTTIPIVMTAAGDPLGSGLVASLARPAATSPG